jgi:hypothetical protein
MANEKFPYKVWPGLAALAVMVGCGVMLKQISRQPDDPTPRGAAQQTDAITIDGWRDKIRQRVSS